MTISNQKLLESIHLFLLILLCKGIMFLNELKQYLIFTIFISK